MHIYQTVSFWHYSVSAVSASYSYLCIWVNRCNIFSQVIIYGSKCSNVGFSDNGNFKLSLNFKLSMSLPQKYKIYHLTCSTITSNYKKSIISIIIFGIYTRCQVVIKSLCSFLTCILLPSSILLALFCSTLRVTLLAEILLQYWGSVCHMLVWIQSYLSSQER